MEYSFTSWAKRRRHQRPKADIIWPLIAASPMGMTRRQIGHAIKLDRPVLDELLTGFVQAGLLTVTWENGVPVFRTQKGRG